MAIRGRDEDWDWHLERRDDGDCEDDYGDCNYTSNTCTETTSTTTSQFSQTAVSSTATTTFSQISTTTGTTLQTSTTSKISALISSNQNKGNQLTSIFTSTSTAISAASGISSNSNSTSGTTKAGISIIVIESTIIIAILIWYLYRRLLRRREANMPQNVTWALGGNGGTAGGVSGAEFAASTFAKSTEPAGYVRPLILQPGQLPLSSNRLGRENAVLEAGAEAEKEHFPSPLFVETASVTSDEHAGNEGLERPRRAIVADVNGKKVASREMRSETNESGAWRESFWAWSKEEDTQSVGSLSSVPRWRTPSVWVADQRRRNRNWGRLSGSV